MTQPHSPTNSPLDPTSDNADDRDVKRAFASPDYGPVHPCPRCGVEISLVYRSFGRRDWVEIATGLHHRYHCAGHDREVAAMLAAVNTPEYMVEQSRPKAPKRPLEPILGMDIGTLDE